MDSGTRQHVYITIVLTGLGGLVSIYVAIVLCALACGIFIGRECAQAEYRWIKEFGNGLRSNMPALAWLRPVVWDYHSYAGLLAPILFGGAYLTVLVYARQLIKIIVERVLT